MVPNLEYILGFFSIRQEVYISNRSISVSQEAVVRAISHGHVYPGDWDMSDELAIDGV